MHTAVRQVGLVLLLAHGHQHTMSLPPHARTADSPGIPWEHSSAAVLVFSDESCTTC